MKILSAALIALSLVSSTVFAKDVVTCTLRGRLMTDNTPTTYTAKIRLINSKLVFEATDSKKVSSACELKGEKIELRVDKKNPKIYQFVALLKVEGDNIELPVLWKDTSGLNIAFGACDSKSVMEVNNVYGDENLKCTKINLSTIPHKKINLE